MAQRRTSPPRRTSRGPSAWEQHIKEEQHIEEKHIEEKHIEENQIEALGFVNAMAQPCIRERLRGSRDLFGCTFLRARK